MRITVADYTYFRSAAVVSRLPVRLPSPPSSYATQTKQEMTKVDKSVLINREDFLAMLEPLKRFAKKKQVGDAALSMEDGDLVISFVGISTGAPATGNWSGEVRVPGRLIWGIAMVPPEGDPIRLEVRDGRLHIGTLVGELPSAKDSEKRRKSLDGPRTGENAAPSFHLPAGQAG